MPLNLLAFFRQLAYLALKRIFFDFLALPLVLWANTVNLYAKLLLLMAPKATVQQPIITLYRYFRLSTINNSYKIRYKFF